MKHKVNDEEFSEIVKSSLSIAEVIRKCNGVLAGGNYRSIKKRIAQLNLDTSHFTGQGWNVGERFKSPVKAKSLVEILVEDSFYQSYKLAKRLLKEGIKKRKCECCGNTTWLDKDIPLELHHINGDNTDNRLENLQLLCPNCHAMTDNYRGKNKGM
jgi:Zn finger protein HypA/HybF involved in hydrogenase expression